MQRMSSSFRRPWSDWWKVGLSLSLSLPKEGEREDCPNVVPPAQYHQRCCKWGLSLNTAVRLTLCAPLSVAPLCATQQAGRWWSSHTVCPPSRTLTRSPCWTHAAWQSAADTQTCSPTDTDCSGNSWRNRPFCMRSRSRPYAETLKGAGKRNSGVVK